MGHGPDCSPEKRDLIKKLRNKGKSYRQIADIVGCSKNMVAYAILDKKSTKNRGQKRRTTAQTDRRILHTAKCDPFKTSVQLKSELNLDVSLSTVRRRLAENNLHGRSARRVPYLSAKNIQQRLKFAKKHSQWSGNEGWHNILFSDETKINLFQSDGRQYVRRPPKQEFRPQYTKKTVKHGGGNI